MVFNFISNIFKSKNKQIEEKAFQHLKEVSAISKLIAREKNDIKLRGLAFSMQRNYDQGMKLLEEINFDMSKIEKAYFDPKKTLSADSTDGLQSITVNGERPFDFIQRCVDNSRSTEYPDSDFVFYEDRDEFVFTPISYLLEQDVVETFIMGDHGIEERTLNKVDNNTRYETISQFEYTGGNDVIRGSSGGKFGNRIDVIDPITKRFKSIVNNYLNIQKSKDKFKTLDRNNIIIDESIFKEDTGQSNKQYHVARLFNDTYQEIEYIKNRITEKNDRFIFHADTAYKSYGRKAMKFNLLDNTTLTIAVPGNSNLLCGKTVNVNIPISSSLEEDKMNPYSHLFGNKKNNKFLITSLTHNFIGNEGRYFTYLTLAKDSYFVDVNKKYSGRYK